MCVSSFCVYPYRTGSGVDVQILSKKEWILDGELKTATVAVRKHQTKTENMKRSKYVKDTTIYQKKRPEEKKRRRRNVCGCNEEHEF